VPVPPLRKIRQPQELQVTNAQCPRLGQRVEEESLAAGQDDPLVALVIRDHHGGRLASGDEVDARRGHLLPGVGRRVIDPDRSIRGPVLAEEHPQAFVRSHGRVPPPWAWWIGRIQLDPGLGLVVPPPQVTTATHRFVEPAEQEQRVADRRERMAHPS
jgi:hypothetical protein